MKTAISQPAALPTMQHKKSGGSRTRQQRLLIRLKLTPHQKKSDDMLQVDGLRPMLTASNILSSLSSQSLKL
jgi:hypothetical protein